MNIGTRQRTVIVGASAAGVATAEALQRLDASREILIVGAERDLAHDRPPLSKQVLEGAWTSEQSQLLPPTRRAALKAELKLGTRAESLDMEARRVCLDDGTDLGFDDLVIATGVRPRHLPVDMPQGVHVLRDMDHCMALRQHLLDESAGPLVIVGGGFIGLEVASTARKLGRDVTVVEPVPETLARRIGFYAAHRLMERHERENVSFRGGVAVAAFEADSNGHVSGVVLTDGSKLDARVVLVAIGCVPNVEWLAGSGIDTSNGVMCDEYCRAAPHVWAAGDVARWMHVGLGRHLRIEHRLNATEQGAAVASNIVGPLRPYVPTPFFWTDQFGTRIQLAGVITPDAQESVERLGDDSYLHTYRVNGRLEAVLGWNAAKAMLSLRKELADQSRLALEVAP